MVHPVWGEAKNRELYDFSKGALISALNDIQYTVIAKIFLSVLDK